MKKPIKTDKNGKVIISKYRFQQIKKHKSPRDIVRVVKALLDAQNEELSADVYNEHVSIVKKHLLQAVTCGSNESKINNWIDSLLDEVESYKSEHIFFHLISTT